MTDKTPTEGHNIDTDAVQKAIANAKTEMDKIDNEREVLNERANVIRAGLREKGIDVKAFNAARQFEKTAEEKRSTFDQSYILSRKAIGLPVQPDLFK